MPETSMPLPLPQDPAAFGAAAGSPVELIQTHIGYVYLVEGFAYKLKKPVRFDFLDFSTLEKRRWACEREVMLNRRLCPRLYLGVYPVIRDVEGVRVGGLDSDAPGQIVDWAVKMHQMPLERLCDRLLAAGAVQAKDVEAIAGVLIPFYSKQRKTIAPGGLGDVEALRFNIDENLREGRTLKAHVLPRAQLDLIEARARRFLARYGDLLKQRVQDGFIVDGHGDLRAENICLPLNEPPLLFDCIEFNDRFRICDSALDIAFLAMELEARGRSDLAEHFVRCYREGCDAGLSDGLLNFYLGYRAFVKGKVEAWIASDSGIDEKERSRAAKSAGRYFDLSLDCALRGEPLLIVFCGVSGSGKSTVARWLAERLRCTHLSTDLIRDELISKSLQRDERYAPDAKAEVYGALFSRATTILRAKQIVLLDGTFTRAEQRARAIEHARAEGVPALLVWTDCPPEAAAEHMREREAQGTKQGSEATEAVSVAQRERFEIPVLEEGFGAILKIDTAQHPRERVMAEAWERVCEAISSALNAVK